MAGEERIYAVDRNFGSNKFEVYSTPITKRTSKTLTVDPTRVTNYKSRLILGEDRVALSAEMAIAFAIGDCGRAIAEAKAKVELMEARKKQIQELHPEPKDGGDPK